MITKEQAMSCGYFFHTSLRNSDGTAVRCRANGNCKTWVRDPERFRLPVKYGLKHCFYITNRNANEWMIYDPTDKERTRNAKRAEMKKLAKKVGLPANTPYTIILDKAKEMDLIPM